MSDRKLAIVITVLLIPFLLAAVFFMPISRYLQGYTGGAWVVDGGNDDIE
jgi:hypothetical protein